MHSHTKCDCRISAPRRISHVTPAYTAVVLIRGCYQNDRWLRNCPRGTIKHIESFLRDTIDANHVLRYSGVGMNAYDTVQKRILTVGASHQLLRPFLG